MVEDRVTRTQNTRRTNAVRLTGGALTVLIVALGGCSSTENANLATGGASSGGSAGQKATGGTATGGASGTATTGGTSGASGSETTGGSETGGSAGASGTSGAGGDGASGGTSGDTGGTTTAGMSGSGNAAGAGSGAGGSAMGGAGSGGKATGGSGGIVAPPGYHLVWSDEFDVDGPPNSSNWSFEQGFVRNEEDQWYQAANARVEGGLLVIEGRRERVTNPNYQAGSTDWKRNRQYAEYTASSLHTRGKHSFQFGRFEMRGRIPTAAGMWPAFWTLGVSGQWPSNGEVDVMEFYNGRVLFNVACGTSTAYTAKWDSVTRPISQLGADWASSFHVWAMVWDDVKIDLYLDDMLMNTSNLADMLNPNGMSPFRQQHYVLVNLAIGGMNGGNPDNTPFPVRYEVDYVRVFQAN
jgi:beta-glucanase (GH16 family)